MSWLDFFRKRGNPAEKKEELDKAGDINIESIRPKLETELKDIDNSYQQIRNGLGQRILRLDSELKIMIDNLRSINLKERREDGRLKAIVRQNLDAYAYSLENLLDNLIVLDKNSQNYLNKAQIVFSNFIRSSVGVLDKATILVGREIRDTKDVLNLFADDVASMANENNKIAARESGTNKIRALLSDFDAKKSAEQLVEDFLVKLEQKLKATEEKRILTLKNLDEMRNSSEYKSSLEEKEKAKHEAQEEIARLKQDIDLKSLAKKFHNDEKRNKIIKDYTENFEETLDSDDNLKIVGIVRDAKPNFDIKRIRKAKLKRCELKNLQQTSIERQIEDTEMDIRTLDLEILDAKKEIERENRKRERLQEKTSQILEDIKKSCR